jgi:hypothetical protein
MTVYRIILIYLCGLALFLVGTSDAVLFTLNTVLLGVAIGMFFMMSR